MSEVEYVRQYFTENARAWLSSAYRSEQVPRAYPVGAERVAIALDIVGRSVDRTKCQLLDLGCGDGRLCIEAAHLGMRATGLDISEAMIGEAKRRVAEAPPEIRQRLRFIVGDVQDSAAAPGRYDAITAIGVVEYLSDDRMFFEVLSHRLQPGGVLVVECRNRLFNIASLNEYTAREMKAGQVDQLLAEISLLFSKGLSWDELAKFVQALKSALPRLEEALALDREETSSTASAAAAPAFLKERRQHTPRDVARLAEAEGFRTVGFVGVHPHPLPPGLQVVAPRFYNQLATVFSELKTAPASLVWSSAFIGIFRL